MVLTALAVLVLNDQVLKRIWPGPVTGKLSDVAGLIVAPLVVQAAWEVLLWLRGRWRGPSRRVLASAIVLVGVAFVAVQLWPPATESWRWLLGTFQWPVQATVAVVRGETPGAIAPVRAVGDAEDLLALPALAISWLVGRERAGRREPPELPEPPERPELPG